MFSSTEMSLSVSHPVGGWSSFQSHAARVDVSIANTAAGGIRARIGPSSLYPPNETGADNSVGAFFPGPALVRVMM